jgi:hypothetical protein
MSLVENVDDCYCYYYYRSRGGDVAMIAEGRFSTGLGFKTQHQIVRVGYCWCKCWLGTRKEIVAGTLDGILLDTHYDERV